MAPEFLNGNRKLGLVRWSLTSKEMASKVEVKKAVAAPVSSKVEEVDLGETYHLAEETKEDIGNDLDDFERRLNGGAPKGAAAVKKAPKAPLRPVPKNNMPPMFVPGSYVKVKPTGLSEDQEDAMEAVKAVTELDRFEARLGK